MTAGNLSPWNSKYMYVGIAHYTIERERVVTSNTILFGTIQSLWSVFALGSYQSGASMQLSQPVKYLLHINQTKHPGGYPGE